MTLPAKILRGLNHPREIQVYLYRAFWAVVISVIFLWNHLRGKKNLIFEICYPTDFWNVEPIWAGLRERKELQIYWSVLNDGLTQVPWREYLKYLREQGIKKRSIIISHVTPKVHGADLHLSPHDWSSRIPRGDIPKIQIFHYLPMKYTLHDKLYNFNMLFFTGPPHLEQYKQFYLKKHPAAQNKQRVFQVGYPRTDALINRDYNEEELKLQLGLDLTRPTVIYAPTWNEGASLRTCGVEIIETLASLKMNVVVKLHPMSLHPPNHIHGTGGVDWREELGRLERLYPNIIPVFGHNCNPYLLISDIMVTDVSGIAFEYALLNRPLIFIDVPEYFKNNPQSDSEKLRQKLGIMVKAPNELPGTISRSLEFPGEFSPQRKKFIDTLLYNPGYSTDVAVKLILQALAQKGKTGR